MKRDLPIRFIKRLKESKLTLTTTVPKQTGYLKSFKTRLTQMNRKKKNEDPSTFLDLLEAFTNDKIKHYKNKLNFLSNKLLSGFLYKISIPVGYQCQSAFRV